VRSEGFYVNEKSTDTSWDRTSDHPICSTAPYPLYYRGPQSFLSVSIILIRFERNLIFFDRFSKNTQTPNCIKIRPVEAKLFDADRRTDMTKLIFALHNFANASKTLTLYREVTARGFITL